MQTYPKWMKLAGDFGPYGTIGLLLAGLATSAAGYASAGSALLQLCLLVAAVTATMRFLIFSKMRTERTQTYLHSSNEIEEYTAEGWPLRSQNRRNRNRDQE